MVIASLCVVVAIAVASGATMCYCNAAETCGCSPGCVQNASIATSGVSGHSAFCSVLATSGPSRSEKRWQFASERVTTTWMTDYIITATPQKSFNDLAVCQNLVPLVNIKIAGKWMFIPLKMVCIGIDP